MKSDNIEFDFGGGYRVGFQWGDFAPRRYLVMSVDAFGCQKLVGDPSRIYGVDVKSDAAKYLIIHRKKKSYNQEISGPQ
jgi:hypothetical protein